MMIFGKSRGTQNTLNGFQIEIPRETPKISDCYFYHTIKYPDGEIINGSWTIRDFHNYIGDFNLSNKTVLDVGTASGFLAFQAEMAGATVTATDAKSAREYRLVPFAHTQYFDDIKAWRNVIEAELFTKMRNSFWYSWHRFHSKVEVFYSSVYDLIEYERRFDVVLCGAIIEHLADPVTAIGAFARLAREAVIIAFTPVVDTDELLMTPLNAWTDPDYAYVWWQLSRGLYKTIFNNLGFDIEIVVSSAYQNAPEGIVKTVRPTIIARRR
jgi:SAM-dependent methyltransferase